MSIEPILYIPLSAPDDLIHSESSFILFTFLPEFLKDIKYQNIRHKTEHKKDSIVMIGFLVITLKAWVYLAFSLASNKGLDQRYVL